VLKASGVILQISEVIGLRVVVENFICVKNIIACSELCADVDFEMSAVVVKGIDAKYTWEIMRIYRAPNDLILEIERSATPTLPTRNLTKWKYIDGYLKLSKGETN